MFKELANFGMKRTARQAVGFYIAYFILLIIVVEILVVALAMVLDVPQESGYRFGVGLGTLLAACASGILSFLVLKEKKALKQFSSIVYLVASVGLGLLGGGILGLLIPAFLTTRESA